MEPSESFLRLVSSRLVRRVSVSLTLSPSLPPSLFLSQRLGRLQGRTLRSHRLLHHCLVLRRRHHRRWKLHLPRFLGHRRLQELPRSGHHQGSRQGLRFSRRRLGFPAVHLPQERVLQGREGLQDDPEMHRQQLHPPRFLRSHHGHNSRQV